VDVSQLTEHHETPINQDILFPAVVRQVIRLPLFGHKVEAGFPSPADDYIQGRLSLDEHRIKHREATFFVRAKGNSMVGSGIFDGDLLVVDKSIVPKSGDIVIAVFDGYSPRFSSDRKSTRLTNASWISAVLTSNC